MLRKYSGSLAAILLSAVCYNLARLPALDAKDTAALASRFRFERFPIPEAPDHPPYKLVRAVHPSLERICAWVSSLGAAATLADLDGDGLSNDLVLVDPRTDRVTVLPAPGTANRFEPFDLPIASRSGDAGDAPTIAPMGSVAGDFNEDGTIDLLVYFWGRTPVLYLRRLAGPEVKPSPAAFVSQALLESDERW